MKPILFLLSFAFSTLAFSQISADSRLSARFSASEISTMEAEQATELKLWNYYLDHAFYIMDVGTKALEYADLADQAAINPATNLPFDVSAESPFDDTFNVLKFDVKPTQNGLTFKVNDTHIIVFYSKSVFLSQFNDTL
ncbi:MAG: hypothetical protein ACPG4W_07680 [Flavobacteriales bacterium]